MRRFNIKSDLRQALTEPCLLNTASCSYIIFLLLARVEFYGLIQSTVAFLTFFFRGRGREFIILQMVVSFHTVLSTYKDTNSLFTQNYP
jgi:hypothetical protein